MVVMTGHMTDPTFARHGLGCDEDWGRGELKKNDDDETRRIGLKAITTENDRPQGEGEDTCLQTMCALH